MCSLTAVYINNISTKRQLHIVYVELNELRIQRECLYALQKRRATHSFSLLIPSSLPLSIHVLVFLWTPGQPCTSHTQMERSQPFLTPSPVCGGPMERSSPPPTIVSRHFRCWQPVLFFNMGGVGGVVVIVFFFLTGRGAGMWDTFPHLGVSKHMSCCPVPLSPLCLSHPLSPFFPVCLCLCALCESLSLLIPIKVHPHPQVGKYNFLCALGNLYNSIWNLNETINVENLKRDSIGEIRKKQEMSLFLFFSFGFSYFCWFFGRMRNNRAVILLCFYTKTQDTN